MFKPKFVSIESVEKQTSRKLRNLAVDKKRAAIQIGVIDDQNLPARDNLLNYGYKVIEVGDINRISDIQDYQIVLCDVMGVGMAFDPNGQGAELIKQIRKQYPNIYILAYTGNLMSNPQAVIAKERADSFIDKDADLEKWSEILDEYIDNVLDPVENWKRTRKNLIEIDTPTLEIIELESAYAKDISANDKSFTNLKKRIGSGGTSGVIKSIIGGLITQALLGMAGV